MFLGEPAAAFFRESIFLKAAVGFFGDGVFDETCGDGRGEICLPQATTAFQ